MSVRHGVVICTRNRPRELAGCLRSLFPQDVPPDVVVVVDSSDDEATREIVHGMRDSFPVRLIYSHSRPGLPRQRNLGLSILRHYVHGKERVAHFIDDDVTVSPSYFGVMCDALGHLPDAVLVGAHDESRVSRRGSIVSRLILVDSSRGGEVLRSGFNVVFKGAEEPTKVDWVSGLAFSVRMDRFPEAPFNTAMRFHSEDVDFGLRANRIGVIYWVPDARVRHTPSPLNRDAISDMIMWTDGAKWHFAREFPDRVSMVCFLYAVTAHAIIRGLDGIVRPSAGGREIAAGHFRFLGRLVRGRSLRQPVD